LAVASCQIVISTMEPSGKVALSWNSFAAFIYGAAYRHSLMASNTIMLIACRTPTRDSERPLSVTLQDRFGHIAERRERLLTGIELDHQIPDYRVDPQPVSCGNSGGPGA